jgi:hypothetical protein
MAAKAKTWIITTGGTRSIAAVAKDLAAAGLKGGRVLKEIGSITGSAGEKAVSKLRKVPGVVDVSPDFPVDIGPPGSPETW